MKSLRYYITKSRQISSYQIAKILSKVYSSDLDISLRKFIVNKNLGLIEKSRNKKSISKIFKNYNEAVYYQTKLNRGEIISINEEETTSYEEYDHIEEEILTTYKTTIKDTVHILHVSEEKELTNGFLPIKELIYEIRSLKNYQTYQQLK